MAVNPAVSNGAGRNTPFRSFYSILVHVLHHSSVKWIAQRANY